MFTQIYTSYWSFYTVFLQFIHDFEQLFYVLYLIAHQSVTENCHLLKPDHFLALVAHVVPHARHIIIIIIIITN